MNLLILRNLLFRIVKSPDPSLDLTVRIGSDGFPEISRRQSERLRKPCAPKAD